MADTIADVVAILARAARLNPPALSPWEIAALPVSSPTCVFVDGWFSQGGQDHLVFVFQRHVTTIERTQKPVISAFSYAGERQSYTYMDTNRDVEAHISTMLSFLEKASENTIIAGYSLGGAVVLLTLDRLLRQVGAERLRATFPLIILLHPAIGGAEQLADYMREHGEVLFGEIPQIVETLGYADTYYPQTATRSIARLLDAGIAVNVFHCPHDTLVPYPTANDRRLWQQPFSIRPAEPLREHIRLHGFPEAHDLLYYLAKPLITWQPTTP